MKTLQDKVAVITGAAAGAIIGATPSRGARTVSPETSM